MTDYSAQRAAIEGHFNSNYSACPVGFDNVDVLNDGNLPNGQEFIRVSLRGLYRNRVGYGDQFVNGGTVMIQIFTVLNEGSERANVYCDALDDLFDQGISGYQFGDAVRGGVVSDESDKTTYVQSIYSIDFQTYQ